MRFEVEIRVCGSFRCGFAENVCRNPENMVLAGLMGQLALLRATSLEYMGDPYAFPPGYNYGPYSGPPMPNEVVYTNFDDAYADSSGGQKPPEFWPLSENATDAVGVASKPGYSA